MKLGLIGAGYWGKNLVREFNNLGVLYTICEANEELLNSYQSDYPTVKLETDWKKMLNSNIDAVCISLPAEMHYTFAKEALNANKNVFVEKPITLDIKQAENLVELAKDKGRTLMVGHLLHYHDCVVKIKELVKSGKIGKILTITSNRLNLGKFRTNENVLWSFAPHDISVILSLVGDLPESVNCQGQSYLSQGIHDITNTILKFKNGVYTNINVSWLNPFKEQKLTIVGETGMIVFDDTLPDNKLLLYTEYLGWSNTLPVFPISTKKKPVVVEYTKTCSPLYNECKHFIECCENKVKCLTPGQEGVNVLKVLDASQKSLNTGNVVEMSKKLFYHATAVIDPGAQIGDGTKIWHFSHICNNAVIGQNCNIGQNVFVAGGSTLGNGCKVQNNVSVYTGVHTGDNVFLGPSCVFTNDINPRCEFPKNGEYTPTHVETGASIGANATILCGVRIGKYSLIGAGAVVTKNVEPYSIMVGNPAKKIGTIDTQGNRKLYKNVLVTGITGSLGRAVCKELLSRENYNIVGIFNSEQKYAHFKRNPDFKNIKTYKINIADSNLSTSMDYILKKHDINYVIHSAAMKHLDICEDNVTEAVKTNIIATETIVNCCKINGVKNLISLSTDKSIEPCNIYGYSKLMMQKLVLKNGYSVYQGANFFWSDGSVLDIWLRQYQNNKDLTITNLEHERYFNTLIYVSKLIVDKLDIKGTIILPEHVYKIKLKDLFTSFCEYYNYHKFVLIGEDKNEKVIEDIDGNIETIISIEVSDIKKLIKEYTDNV